jgi:hypothetical protein
MEMDKKHGPERSSSKLLSTSDSTKVKTDSKPAGKGSGDSGFYINDRGQTCYGNKCVSIAIDEERREVIVNVKRSATCNIDPLVESLRKTLGKGSRTVYEVENEDD